VSGTNTELSVIAVVQEEDRLRAVEVHRGPGGPQVVWAKSSEAGQLDWTSFAADCGLTVGRAQPDRRAGRTQVAIGLRPVGAAFYRLTVPVVPEEEMEALVGMQAEARLPLSMDQMETAWRITNRGSDQVTVTLAALRRKQAQSLIDQIRPLAPDRVILSCEALVKAWTAVFSEAQPDDAVVVALDARSTVVCLVEKGVLGHMAMIDMGTEDLVAEHLGIPSGDPARKAGLTGVEGQFVQDFRAILDGFPRSSTQEDWPIQILSDGNPVIEYVAGLLQGTGLSVGVSTPKAKTVSAQFSPGQWYEYKTALGLALMMIEPPSHAQGAKGLDLFKGLYCPPGEEQDRKTRFSTRTATAIAAVALVAMLLVSYLTDLALARRLSGLVKQHNLVELKAVRDARQTVSSYRLNVLTLLKELNAVIPVVEQTTRWGGRGGPMGPEGMPPATPSATSSSPDAGSSGGRAEVAQSGQGLPEMLTMRTGFMGRGGRGDRSGGRGPSGMSGPGGQETVGIVLNNVTIRRGQSIQIDGQAERPEQIYAFEQALQKREGVGRVDPPKYVQDTQTRKVKFTIKFQYKNFTQKGAR